MGKRAERRSVTVQLRRREVKCFAKERTRRE